MVLHPIRIFISSPGDVTDERALALRVIDQLPYDPFLRGKVTFEVVAWDKPGAGTPLLATMTPQEAINQGLPQPSECDIVVVIFWSRMGTPLPYPQYQKADGSPYWSGTEWEYADAMRAAFQFKRPEVVVYRRTEKVLLDDEAVDFQQLLEQKQRLRDFFAKFQDPKSGAILHGYNQYAKPDDFRREFESHLRVLVRRLIETPVPRPREAKTTDPISLWAGSPFPGLRAFTPADEPIFYGRGQETDALLSRTDLNRFVAVIGASGSGKSSLVGAGLIPRLRGNAIPGSKDWLLPDYKDNQWTGLRFTPGELGDNPFMALAVKLAPLINVTPREVVEELATGDAAIVMSQALVEKSTWTELLVFIDQFEELFTLVAEAHRQAFIDMLVLVSKLERFRVVITMRADFYHQAVEHMALALLLRSGSFPLAAPSLGSLLEMITRPAERAGLIFEKHLPERILVDTGEHPGALPLMAYTLDELYQRRTNDLLTAEMYDDVGRVQGAIGKRAEQTYQNLQMDDKDTLLGQVFRDLVEVDEKGGATRRRTKLANLMINAVRANLVKAFTDARLLVTDEQGTEATIEVAHEALFRSWARLAEWIIQWQDDLRLLRQFERDAHAWDRRGRLQEEQPRNEQLKPLLTAIEHLQMEITDYPLLFEYIDLDKERLLEEIKDINTTHERRSFIGKRLAMLGDSRPGVGNETLRIGEQIVEIPRIEWCYVDAVPDKKGTLPQIKIGKHSYLIQPFWIGRYVITAKQFDAFVKDAEGYENPVWWPTSVPPELPNWQQLSNEPAVWLTWYQAVAFCHWLDGKYRKLGLYDRIVQVNNYSIDASPSTTMSLDSSKYEIRLPTEWEWQWAAQGGAEHRKYPWGERDGRQAATGEGRYGEIVAVGMYPSGAAKCGALDISGNIWEWCLSESIKSQKGLRGGSYLDSLDGSSCTYRNYYYPEPADYPSGIRVILGENILYSLNSEDESTDEA